MGEYSIGFAAATSDIKRFGIVHARDFAAMCEGNMNTFLIGYRTRVSLSREKQAN